MLYAAPKQGVDALLGLNIVAQPGMKIARPLVTYNQGELGLTPVQAELAYQRARADRLEDRVSQLSDLAQAGTAAAGVAHDENNVLTAVLGYADLLLMDNLNPDATEMVTEIKRAALRGRDLNQMLMDLSRSQAYIFQPHDITTTLAKIITPSNSKNISVETDYQADLGQVYVDHKHLLRVFLVLYSNATDAMPNGGTITVRAENYTGPTRTLEDDCYVHVTVSDTGTGIPEDVLARIFEPFYTHGKENGKGIGLASALDIVHKHGGDIECESVVGKGTAFHIYLPMYMGATATFQGQGEHHIERILCITPDDGAREILPVRFGVLGYPTTAVADNATALKTLTNDPAYGYLVAQGPDFLTRSGETIEDAAAQLVPDIGVIIANPPDSPLPKHNGHYIGTVPDVTGTRAIVKLLRR